MKSIHPSLTPLDTSLPPTVAAKPQVQFDSADALAGQLVHEMTVAWRQGRRITSEELLGRHPGLRARREAVLRLVCEEICLRREHDLTLVMDDWRRRFPEWRTEIEALLECQRLIEPEIAAPSTRALGRLHGFQLVSELGQGGHGRVYLATQPDLANRPVVLKVIPCRGHEKDSLARLQHTHIVPIYSHSDDLDKDERVLCMPYYGSVTLQHLLTKLQPVPLAERTGAHILAALDDAEAHRPPTGLPRGPARQLLGRASYAQAIVWMGASLAEALQYAHERNLLHLDLKPSNVLWTTEGQPMLLDFHLARPPIRADGLRPHGLGGTPMWMAPEHEMALHAVFQNRPIPGGIDARADIFAVGLLLHHALGGAVPVPVDKPPRLDAINSQVSPGLADIVRRCLARDPNHRYADADALAVDLRRHLSDLPLRGVRNRSLAERWDKWRRREPYALMSFILVAMMLAVTVAAGAWWAWQRSEQAARDEALRRDAAARVLQSEKMLAQAKAHAHEQKYELALAALEAGKALVPEGPAPQTQRLVKAFYQQEQQARRQHARRLLHDGVDMLRAAVVADRLGAGQIAVLERASRELWERRDTILTDAEGVDPDTRQDVIDLAVIWSELVLRQTPAAELPQARQAVAAVLNETEKRCGASALLDALRNQRHIERGSDPSKAEEAPSPKLAAWEHVALARRLLLHPEDGRSAASLVGRLALRSPAECCVAAAAGSALAPARLTTWHLEQAVAQEPDHYWAHFYQGIAAYRAQRFADAAIAFRVAVALRPRHPGGYHNRALAAAGAGDLNQALADYTKALELDPGFYAAAWNRGLIHVKLRDFEAALADLRLAQARGADPQAIQADINRVTQMRKTALP